MINLKYICLSFFLISGISHAGLTKYGIYEGWVKDFNKKEVKIKWRGRVVTVPRSSIPKAYKIKSGNFVVAKVKADEKALKGLKELQQKYKK